MKVVTISGFKGGTGKTTIASLLSVAAVGDGLRTAGLDLDRNTRNFSSFLSRRRASGLPSPDHVMVLDIENPARRRNSGRLEPLVRMARLDGYDLLVIDTSSGAQTDLYEAHLLADIIVTPMNESPADLHGLFAPSKSPQAPQVNYRDMIDTVRFDRKRARLPVQRWHVCRNRVSALPTRIGQTVEQRVAALSREAGFEAVWSLRDRVGHRSIALEGRTVFDPPSEGRLTMSELAGRSEVRAMLSMLDGPTAVPMAA
ncbi:MAG: division plane positioning ATPase MipZ [Alphaproteobacteria bacterium]|nr:division plane positioning ATPase MipZ [Alphaproteobacteria bacterium]